MKKYMNGLIVLFVFAAMAFSVSAAELDLENKNPSTWVAMENDGISGTLEYNGAGPEFVYSFEGKVLEENTKHALVYYIDIGPTDPVHGKPWNLANSVKLATGSSDGDGNLIISGNNDLGDLPFPEDYNANPNEDDSYCSGENGYDYYKHCSGAKMWIMPESDFDAVAWNPTAWLFETDLITYVEDDDAPEITEITQTPENPKTTDNVIICAIVEDASEVEGVKVSIDGGNSYPMINTEGNKWCKTLSALTLNEEEEDGLTISYHIGAEDVFGNSDWEPNGFDLSFTYDGSNPLVGVSGAGIWQSSAEAGVTCDDLISGCKESSYKLYSSIEPLAECSTDASDYVLSSPQSITESSWVCGYAEDNAGLFGVSEPAEFVVDSENPTGALTGVPLVWQNEDAELTLSCTDGGSECNEDEDYLTVVPFGESCVATDPYVGSVVVDAHSTACWKVTDNAGNEDSGSAEILVDKISPTPVITTDLEDNEVLKLGSINFNGETGSLDEDSGISSYLWDFGDEASSTEPNPTHSYEEEGDYVVTLTITDNAGNNESVNITIFVYLYSVELNEGWNLISLPLVPKNDAVGIESVLSDVGENVESVWSYQQGEWLYFRGAEGDTLTAMVPGFGYYIKMKNSDSLFLSGEKMYNFDENAQPPSVLLTPGWNLIGHYGMNDVVREDALTTLADNYATVISEDGTPVSELNPTHGYWLVLTGNNEIPYAPSDADYGEFN